MKFICVLLIIYKLSNAQDTLDDITTLATSIRKFYSSPSIFVIYDSHIFDFSNEKILFDALRSYSTQNSMSQAITFNDLKKAYDRRENALYAFTIHTRENLDRAVNATKKIGISAHPWLLFMIGNVTGFDCDVPGKNFFKLRMDTKMMAKCRGNNMVKRYYAIFENRTEVTNLAEWTSEKKLEFASKQSLLEVETDFKGITLRVAERTEPLGKIDSNPADFRWNLTKELANIGNFKLNITFREDMTGYFDNRTKRWNGLMKAIIDEKADICTVLLAMDEERARVVDFATPVVASQNYLYAKLPNTSQVPWTAYFKAFNAKSWIAIGSFIIFFSVLLSFVKNKSGTKHSISDSFINVLGVFYQQGSIGYTSTISTRILFFFILVFSLALNAIYSAAIASYITAMKIELPFSTYEEFISDTSNKLAVLKNTNDKSLIEGNDTLLSPFKHHLKDDCDLPTDTVEGFDQVCNEEKTTLYTDERSYKGLMKPPKCKVDWVKVDRIEYFSYILPKKGPYTESINYLVLKLKEHGILNKLKNQYFYNYKELADLLHNAINFEEILPIIAILLAGMLASLFVYSLEIIAYHVSAHFRHAKMKMIVRRRCCKVMKNRKKVTFQRNFRFKIRAVKRQNGNLRR